MRAWPNVSACVVLADAFMPASGESFFDRHRYRAWLGATANGTARLVALFPNPIARYPLDDAEEALLVGADHLFDDRVRRSAA